MKKLSFIIFLITCSSFLSNILAGDFSYLTPDSVLITFTYEENCINPNVIVECTGGNVNKMYNLSCITLTDEQPTGYFPTLALLSPSYHEEYDGNIDLFSGNVVEIGSQEGYINQTDNTIHISVYNSQGIMYSLCIDLIMYNGQLLKSDWEQVYQ